MLVYCSHISLVPSPDNSLILECITDWLSHKPGLSSLSSSSITGNGTKELPDNSTLNWISAEHNDEQWQAIRYSHPDRGSAHGREWLTDIGIYRHRDKHTCSIMLHTHEQSTLVDPNIQTTRPRVVENIFAKCPVASNTPGGTVQNLTVDDTEAFMYVVQSPSRFYPIVQISCETTGRYLIDPIRTASLLAGIAAVTAIPADVNTYKLESELNGRFCCYNGAVNIIWPNVSTRGSRHTPVQRILPHQIETVRATGTWPESQLLATICHRMNEVYARNHISLHTVQAVKHRVALEEARNATHNIDPALEEALRQVDHDQRHEILELKSTLDERDKSLAVLQSELEDADRKIDSLKASLSQADRPQQTQLNEEVRAAIIQATSESTILPNMLRVLELLYPDRLVVLDSARRSAKDASEFKHPRRAFGLLNLLCTDYWQHLVDGKGNAEGKSVFGNAYAGKESETVENNKRARKLRTFNYNGNSIEMMPHLKIGNKDSKTETWRAHFYWDSPSKLIVLGHCGKHLDHK